MLPFAGYAFNKSHTAGYGLVSYWTAYLKANYPAEFMAAQLTSIGDNKDKSAIYLAECRRMGIKVLPPDVNDSGLYSPQWAATSGSAWARSATWAPMSCSRSSPPVRRRADTRRSPTSWTRSSWSAATNGRSNLDQGRRVRLLRSHPALARRSP